MQTWEVPVGAGLLKLDKALQTHLEISRRDARLLIAAGQVFVAGRLCRILTRPIKPGTPIAVQAPSAGASSSGGLTRHRQPPAPPMRILYLDRWVVAVAKPTGLLSEPDRFGGPSVMSHLTRELDMRGEHQRLWLVHRLDATTSGVLLLARTPGAAARLNEAFRSREVDKTYAAVATGRMAVGSVEVDEPIGWMKGTRHAVMADGRPANTLFQCRAAKPQSSLVIASPRTGRTHQIRVHLAHLGFPILGDTLYGGLRYVEFAQGGRKPVLRAMLHALRLSLNHPKEDRRLVLHCPLPDDFCEVIRALEMDESDLRWDKTTQGALPNG